MQLRQSLVADASHGQQVAGITFPPRSSSTGPLDGNDPQVVVTRQRLLLSWIECVLESPPVDLRTTNSGLSAVSSAASAAGEGEGLLHSPDLLLFLGMRRAAQLQRERRKAVTKRQWVGAGVAGKQGSSAVDSTDRLGRSITELLAVQHGAATADTIDEQLAVCAAFVAVMPKLLFPVREVTSTMARTKKRTIWLGQDGLELLRPPDGGIVPTGGDRGGEVSLQLQ